MSQGRYVSGELVRSVYVVNMSSGGGSGTPGGADTQVQFNDGGSFAGDSGLTYNGIAGTLTVGGKTATTDAPILNLSQTWNNAATTFTGLKLNVTDTASAADSNLLDLQVGGATKFKATTNGSITATSAAFGTVNIDSNAIYGAPLGWPTSPSWGGIKQINMYQSGTGIGFIQWNADVYLNRDSAGVLAITDGSAGTGYLKLIPTTVGALTAAATVGAGTKAFVTDSTSTLSSHHGQAVVGGGTNFVPVFSDGTNWIVG